MTHRGYNPRTGRFLSRDPIGYEGGINLYAYAGNNPVMFADPSGLQAINMDAEWNAFVDRLLGVASSVTSLLDPVTPLIESAANAGYTQGLYDGGYASGFDLFKSYANYGINLASSASLAKDLLANIGRSISAGATTRINLFGPSGAYDEVGGHHIHAKAAFSNVTEYDAGKAFTISNQYMKLRGWSHNAMTQRQAKLFDEMSAGLRPNTMKGHSAVAVEALMAGGATKAEARKLTATSLRNLRGQSVKKPGRIPPFPPFVQRN